MKYYLVIFVLMLLSYTTYSQDIFCLKDEIIVKDSGYVYTFYRTELDLILDHIQIFSKEFIPKDKFKKQTLFRLLKDTNNYIYFIPMQYVRLKTKLGIIDSKYNYFYTSDEFKKQFLTLRNNFELVYSKKFKKKYVLKVEKQEAKMFRATFNKPCIEMWYKRYKKNLISDEIIVVCPYIQEFDKIK